MCHGQKKYQHKRIPKGQTPRQVMTRVNLILSWNMKYKNQLQEHKIKNIKHARCKSK